MGNGGTENECDESFRQLVKRKENQQGKNTEFSKSNEEILGVLYNDAPRYCYSDH